MTDQVRDTLRSIRLATATSFAVWATLNLLLLAYSYFSSGELGACVFILIAAFAFANLGARSVARQVKFNKGRASIPAVELGAVILVVLFVTTLLQQVLLAVLT